MGIAELDFRRHAQLKQGLQSELKEELINSCEDQRCARTGWQITPGWDDEEDMPDDTMTRCPCYQRMNLGVDMFDAGIPREFWGVEDLEPDFNKHAFEMMHEYAANLDRACKHGLGFVLTGRNGVGKTSSACIPLIAALRSGRSGALVSWPDYIEGARRAWRDAALARHLDERLMREVLVIDELGKEHVTSDETFVAGKLDSVLRSRRGALMPTIIITNYKISELVERYGASIESLIADRFKTITYRPGDFRAKVASTFDWDATLKGGSDV